MLYGGNGKPFAGGRPLATPFGTLFSGASTPDPKTGIGLYSQAALRGRCATGIDRAGRDLYPVFPYNHFARLTDEDLSALYAFLMTRAAVPAQNPANHLTFPYNVRPLLAGWKSFISTRSQCRATRQGAPNEIAAAISSKRCRIVAHVTRRGTASAPKSHRNILTAAKPDWWAPPLNHKFPSPVSWSEESLFNYLRSWDVGHGGAVGPMAPVVAALATVPEQDVRAIAAYVGATLAKPGESEKRVDEKQPQAAEAHPQGAELYAGICATCHETGGHVPFTVTSLGQHTSIYAPIPAT